MLQLIKGVVDTQKSIFKSIGQVNSGDDVELELTIEMNGKPVEFISPQSELIIKKFDNNVVRQLHDIVYEEGKFKIKLDKQGVTCTGIVVNQLTINDGGRISTCLFYFMVNTSLDGEILKSISKVEALEQLEEYIVAAFANLKIFEERVLSSDETIRKLNYDMNESEKIREAAEQQRQDNFNSMKLENDNFKKGINEQYETIVTEFDKVIANVTNGNENATNSEIVQARGKEVNLNARLDNFDEQLDNMTNEVTNIKTNRPVIDKMLIMTDSLGASGEFKTQLAERFTVSESIENVKGGQQISMGLCALSEKIYCKQVDENLLKWSNDLTKWSKTSGINIEKETLGDGLIWNKITKTDDSANRTVYQEGNLSDSNVTLKYPSDGCGAVMGFDLYLPKGCNCKRVGVYIENITTGVGQKYYVTGADLPDDRTIRVIVYYNKDEITWTKGAEERIKFTIHLNKNANDEACYAYVKNCYLSFHPISGYQKYIPTTDKGIIGDISQATYKEIERNPYILQNLDMITLQYGRNDSGDGVSYTSFFKAYDKLVYESKRWASVVVPLNPPPLKGTGDIWQPTDSYLDNRYLETFKKYMFRWNVGINIFEYFKALISNGIYSQSELYGDTIHTNQLGASVMIDEIEKDINKKVNVINNFTPKLSNKIKYYLHGEDNGNWNTEYINQFDIEQKILLGDFRGALAKVSSIAGDYLEFNNIECEQLHIIFRENKQYGSFKVVIDEGTGNEISKTFICNLYEDRQAGKFLIDFGDNGTHNIKIYNLENKKIVIYGLVAI